MYRFSDGHLGPSLQFCWRVGCIVRIEKQSQRMAVSGLLLGPGGKRSNRIGTKGGMLIVVSLGPANGPGAWKRLDCSTILCRTSVEDWYLEVIHPRIRETAS